MPPQNKKGLPLASGRWQAADGSGANLGITIQNGFKHPLDDLLLSDFIDALSDEVAILDAEGVIVATNRAWDQFCKENGGSASHCYRGLNYLHICRTAEGTSSAEAAIIPDGFIKTLRTGETFQCEYPCNSPTVKRWFELTANRLVQDGRTYLVVQHRNITTRHVEHEAVERAYVTSSAMAALVATTSDAILSYDLDGNVITWNPAAEKLYGYTEEEMTGRSLEVLYPQDWPKRITYYRDEILAGRLESFEAIRVAKDGTSRTVWISCAPIRSTNGEVIAISNIHRDITEVRNAERARDLIAHEVIHRAKNMLTIISAIQRQTARVENTFEGFMSSFEARLQALSQSTDLLVKSAWTSIGLEVLIEKHLRPFVQRKGNLTNVAGEPVNLQPQSVQTVGMAVHELATNSAKYGVLKKRKGRIDIAWFVETDACEPTLKLSWRETCVDGRTVDPRKGFGNTVLTALAPAMLNADSEYAIGPDEVCWSIRIPSQYFEKDLAQ